MSLSKGYLKKQNPLQLKHILIGIACWIAFAYILYGFFYILREIMRLLTSGSEPGENTLLILNPEENYIYNLFYASIASALSYMFAFKLILSSYFFISSGRIRLKVRRLSNELGFNIWTFLYWFGKLSSILGIWYLIDPIQYDINFLKEFPEFLIMLPLVLFLSTAHRVRDIVGAQWKKWLLLSSSIFILMSFLFAFKDFINVEVLNMSLKKRIIETAYDLQMPESTTHDHIQRFSLSSNLYVVRDSLGDEKPLLFINSISQPTTFAKLSIDIKSEQERLAEYERNRLIINIMMDSSLSINYLNQIKQELRKIGVRHIQFSTGVSNSKYPSNYPYFKYVGIPQSLPIYYPQLKSFLDSIDHANLNRYKISLPESDLYRNEAVRKSNRVKITVDEKHVYLNNQLVSAAKLNKTLYLLIKKYSPDFKVIYEPNPQISYGRYIKYLDLILSVNNQLRNELSIQLEGKGFDPNKNYPSSNEKFILSQYHDNIVEWSEEEKRLNALLEKSKKN